MSWLQIAISGLGVRAALRRRPTWAPRPSARQLRGRARPNWASDSADAHLRKDLRSAGTRRPAADHRDADRPAEVHRGGRAGGDRRRGGAQVQAQCGSGQPEHRRSRTMKIVCNWPRDENRLVAAPRSQERKKLRAPQYKMHDAHTKRYSEAARQRLKAIGQPENGILFRFSLHTVTGISMNNARTVIL